MTDPRATEVPHTLPSAPTAGRSTVVSDTLPNYSANTQDPRTLPAADDVVPTFEAGICAFPGGPSLLEALGENRNNGDGVGKGDAGKIIENLQENDKAKNINAKKNTDNEANNSPEDQNQKYDVNAVKYDVNDETRASFGQASFAQSSRGAENSQNRSQPLGSGKNRKIFRGDSGALENTTLQVPEKHNTAFFGDLLESIRLKRTVGMFNINEDVHSNNNNNNNSNDNPSSLNTSSLPKNRIAPAISIADHAGDDLQWSNNESDSDGVYGPVYGRQTQIQREIQKITKEQEETRGFGQHSIDEIMRRRSLRVRRLGERISERARRGGEEGRNFL
jgi:hypothetical protein